MGVYARDVQIILIGPHNWYGAAKDQIEPGDYFSFSPLENIFSRIREYWDSEEGEDEDESLELRYPEEENPLDEKPVIYGFEFLKKRKIEINPETDSDEYS